MLSANFPTEVIIFCRPDLYDESSHPARCPMEFGLSSSIASNERDHPMTSKIIKF